MKSLIYITALLSLAAPSYATEYIYRDLMANTLPSAQCESLETAQEDASKSYKMKRFSKKFCQTQGYGWHIDEIKNEGTVACNSCPSDASSYKCHMEDVVVKCKRIKPGTVGMLPGKG